MSAVGVSPDLLGRGGSGLDDESESENDDGQFRSKRSRSDDDGQAGWDDILASGEEAPEESEDDDATQEQYSPELGE